MIQLKSKLGLLAHSERFPEVLGLPKIFRIPSPAAGANLSWAVPDLMLIKPLAFNLQLVTSITAANRSLALEVRDTGGASITTIQDDTVIVASSTQAYSFIRGLSDGLGSRNTRLTLPLPKQYWLPGLTLNTVVENLQAGDQLSAVRLYAEVWYLDEEIKDWAR